MSGRHAACRRLSSFWQALANVLLLRVVVIYIPSVYINLSAVELAGLFQSVCLLHRLWDFPDCGTKSGNWLLCSCQVPELYEQQQTQPRNQATSFWATADIASCSISTVPSLPALLYPRESRRAGEGRLPLEIRYLVPCFTPHFYSTIM